MYEVRVDVEKNRIYVVLGEINTGDGEKMIQLVKDGVAKLRSPFTCVSDISDFSLLDPGEGKWADTGLKILARAGMARAVRVTRHKVKYSEKKEKYGYIVSPAPTVDAADDILDAYEADQNLS